MEQAPSQAKTGAERKTREEAASFEQRERKKAEDEAAAARQRAEAGEVAAQQKAFAKPAADKTPQVGLESLKAASPCRCCRSISECCTSNGWPVTAGRD